MMDSEQEVQTHVLEGDDRERKFLFENVTVNSNNSAEIMNEEQSTRAKYWQIQSDDIVVDIGACFGSYTLPALARGAALVLAFEPDELLMKSLRNNLRLNNPEWSGRCATIKLYLGDSEWQKEKIRMTTLDNFFGNQYPFLSHIDWIKIDVDEMEPEVLEGGTFIIKKYKPSLLIHTDYVAAVDKWLDSEFKSNGFKFTKEIKADNFIFVKFRRT